MTTDDMEEHIKMEEYIEQLHGKIDTLVTMEEWIKQLHKEIDILRVLLEEAINYPVTAMPKSWVVRVKEVLRGV